MKPASLYLVTRSLSVLAMYLASRIPLTPAWWGSPFSSAQRSLINIGTPLKGPSGRSDEAANSKAFSNWRWITEFRSLSNRSILSIVIETTSTGESSLSLIIFAKATASTRDKSSLVSVLDGDSVIEEKLVPKSQLVIFRTLKIVINRKTANF